MTEWNLNRDFFGLNSKFQTGRESYKIGDFFIKKYVDRHECEYEYAMLRKIIDIHPANFLVPKVFKTYVNSSGFFIIMERIKGSYLKNYIVNYLLLRENKALEVFTDLGSALREFHRSPLEGLHPCSLPNSCRKVKLEISMLSERLATSHIISNELKKAILDYIGRINNMDDEIFGCVNLHGEFYFTHIILSKDKFVFVDFHDACRGPAYFDLAMLSTSLYVSLTLPFYTPRQLAPLINAFLKGYCRKCLNNKMFELIKLGELYVILREILKYSRALQTSSFMNKLLATLKIKRLKTAIEEVIIPYISG